MIFGSAGDRYAGLLGVKRLLEGAATRFEANFSRFFVFVLVSVFVFVVFCDFSDFFS